MGGLSIISKGLAVFIPLELDAFILFILLEMAGFLLTGYWVSIIKTGK